MSVPKLYKDQSGFGGEDYGDPYGLGGPLHVVRARAVESQTVRVVFDEPPEFRSRGADSDGRNPLNYSVDIVTGQGTKPQVVGVKDTIVLPGAAGVYTDPERGVDVQTDRPLVLGIQYLVTVVNVRAKAGGALGAPYSANFEGVFQQSQVNPAPPTLQYSDFKFDIFGKSASAFVFDDAGDVALDAGVENIRKRILRRLMTPKNAFRHLPGYGTNWALKAPLSTRELVPTKHDILQQVKQDPEVLDASVSVTLQPADDLVIVRIKARTARGDVSATVTQGATSGLVIT